jgi:hypothetical protein
MTRRHARSIDRARKRNDARPAKARAAQQLLAELGKSGRDRTTNQLPERENT